MTLKKLTASFIGAALTLTAPGLGCWQAVAQVVNQAGEPVLTGTTAGHIPR